MRIISALLIALLLSCSQFNTSESESTYKIFTQKKITENKGRHVTSIGELRTLIVYVVFTDDNKTKSDAWKFSKTELPEWSYKMLNSTTALNFPYDNLTQYFYEMSYGNLMLYGDIYPTVVVPKYNQKHYKNIGEVNSEVLLRIDKDVDFSKYDNWSKGKDGKYLNVPDGKVDNIFIVYRNFENRLYFNNGWTGIAHLHLKNDITTNDGVKITKGRLDQGSGISSRGGKVGFTYLKYVLAHEFGHFLFGSGHMENTTHLALMTGGPVWNASRGMHSWEKERLGWIDYKDIKLNENSSVSIDDYHKSGEAYKIKLSDNEWYVFENHLGLSKHDWAKDGGLYIYHINIANRFAPNITVKCADGNWDFEIDETSKKLKKLFPNFSGKSEIDYKKLVKKKSYACYEEVYEDNSAWGDIYDAFDLSYNNVFSPVSNPSSNNKAKVEFAVEVKEKIGNKLLVNFKFVDIYKNIAPSKPQMLNVVNKKSKTFIKWMANKEPDMKSYKVYYSINSNKNLKFYRKVGNSKDQELDVTGLLHDKKDKFNIAVSAIDNEGLESVKSNFVVITFNSSTKMWEGKIIEEI